MHTTSPTVSRTQTARLIGVTTDTLKDWARATPPRGPRCVKLGGRKQSRTLYAIAEIEAWQRDPQGYEQRTYGGQHGNR
jgi:hypothetical protein